MFPQVHETAICPSCKKELDPHEAYHSEYLCGEELCPASPKLEKILGCKMHYFCTKDCYEKFKASPRSCNVTYYNHWMKRIIKAGCGREIT